MDEYLIGAGAILTAGPEASISGATLHAQVERGLARRVEAAVIDFEATQPTEVSRLLLVVQGWSGARFRAEVVRRLLERRECTLADVISTLAEAAGTTEVHLFAHWLLDAASAEALEERGLQVVTHPLEAIGQAALVSGQRVERWAERARSGDSKGEKARCSVEMYVMPNARVAVIDDDRMVREMLELGLSREGYEVRTATDGLAALELVKVFDPELIVLDIMMPKIDGVTLLPRLREITQAPILMLTAKGGTDDKVRSLSSGADDYLVKPFVFEELIARLQAKLRRPQLIEENVLRWRDISINPGTHEAWRGKDVLEFTQREFDLLEVFMREPRRVFSKDHLLEIVWGHDFEGGPNIVETYISYLRAKIDRPGEAGSFIRTVRGVGYGLSQ